MSEQGRNRCVVFNVSQPHWIPRELAEEWLGWFRFHGIDAHDVRLGHPVICQDTSCQISWTGRDGERHYVQGETPAMPFPDLDERYGFFGAEISEELMSS